MIKIHILHHTFMIYVIHAIMCILTGGNQIQNGFGLLKVKCVLLWLVPSNVYLAGTI